MFLAILSLWFVTSGVIIVLYAGRELVDVWNEPVLLRPVMIIESDDWGAGPPDQAAALSSIKNVLTNVSDCDGRHPVMTLGVILSTPNGERINDGDIYFRSIISTHTHGDMLDVINGGVDAGVFSIQLHGMEHYWPATILAAAKSSTKVNDWLKQTPAAFTEELPAPLQSRWVDTSLLPSQQLPGEDIRRAVEEEVETFYTLFGVKPEVVVPPTFIWGARVERAWAEAGVKVIVTPGRRIEARDAAGSPVTVGKSLYNAQSGEHGIVYMVRDVYFEPSLGHKADQTLEVCASYIRLKRPVLLETHRFNFIGARVDSVSALEELEHLLRHAVKKFPDIAFLPTGRLANVMKSRSPEWVERRLRHRLHVCINRLGEMPRLRKLVMFSGWIVPVWLVLKLTQ